MARTKSKRKFGAKRMWIQRWLKAGRISWIEARKFTKTLEKSGKLLKPTKAIKTVAAAQSRAVALSERVVTVQYDPSEFRVQFEVIQRRHKPKS